MNRILLKAEELNTESTCIWSAGDYRAKHLRQILKIKSGQSFAAGILHSRITGHLTILQERADASLLLQFKGENDYSEERCWLNLSLGLGLVRPLVLKRLLKDLSSAGVKDIYLIQAELCEGDYCKSHIWDEIEQCFILGAEQGRINRLPRLYCEARAGISLTEFLEQAKEAVRQQEVRAEDCIVFEENGSVLQQYKKSSKEDDLKNKEEACYMALGPERGWTKQEIRQFTEADFLVRSFGSLTLRTEVAAHFALAHYLSQYF